MLKYWCSVVINDVYNDAALIYSLVMRLWRDKCQVYENTTYRYKLPFDNCFHTVSGVSERPRSESPLHDEPTNTLRGFSISLPLGIFIPADLLTTFVSILSKNSSPSLLCFIVFHLRSDIKQSLPPRLREASTDIQSFWPGSARGAIFKLGILWVNIWSTSFIFLHAFSFPSKKRLFPKYWKNYSSIVHYCWFKTVIIWNSLTAGMC